MDKEAIGGQLPEVAPPGLLTWACNNLVEDLGGEYCIFKAERVSRPPYFEEIMEFQSMKPKSSVWAARCACTACQEDFITSKEVGANNILLLEGEDGCHYTLEPWGEIEPHTHYVRQKPGDTFPCPYCDTTVELIHSRQLRHGRTKKVMVISVENVAQYTGIFYWMVQRTMNEFGLSDYQVLPRDAYILTEHGGLVRYSHMNPVYFGNMSESKGWRVMTSNADTFDQLYHDSGSICNRKRGGVVFPDYPSLASRTGEKTGLIEYLQAGGERPVRYLKLWRKYRCLENLNKAGQGKLVVQLIMKSLYYRTFEEIADDYIDLSKKKPHEMLRMSKADFKRLRKLGTELDCNQLNKWKEYKEITGSHTFLDFSEDREAFGTAGLRLALECINEQPGTTIDRIKNYMDRQRMRYRDVGLLRDTRRMTHRLYGRELTSEELWPRNLQQSHDRVAQMLADRERKEKSMELEDGFQKVIERYGELEWSDGDLRVLLPRGNEELIREGKVLRHCVGTYGRTHAKGNSIILFIRRRRRPERPYYTLNISFAGVEPKEIQLHGYGNERHGEHKEYTHRIPRKVREFCNRWEREIMMPWWVNNKDKKENTA